MNTPWPWRLVAGLLSILVALTASASGQIADPKTGFAEAVAQFGLALEGTYGDEGPRVLAGIDALDRGLARWDDTIRTYERAMEAETKNAEPGVAALAHLALGGVYLDRSRVADALREFTAATQLDPKRIDAFTLLGVANSPPFPSNAAAAIAAFQKASALDPEDVTSAYLLARELARAGKADDAARSWRRVADMFRRRMDERSVATAAPFMRFGIVDERSGVEPFFPPAIYAEGFALLAQGNYPAALAVPPRVVVARSAGGRRGQPLRDAAGRRCVPRWARSTRPSNNCRRPSSSRPSGPSRTGSSGWSGPRTNNTTAAPAN